MLKFKTFKEAKQDPREYDYEGDMAKSQLKSIIANAQAIHDMLEDTTNLAEWVQSKITLAEDYISTVSNYMQSEISEASYGPQEKGLSKDEWKSKVKAHHPDVEFTDTSNAQHQSHVAHIPWGKNEKHRVGVWTTANPGGPHHDIDYGRLTTAPK
jgi:hypothetical protein